MQGLSSPGNWPLAILLSFFYLITRLPFVWQQKTGQWLGLALYYLGPARRHIAAVNLGLCFPEMDNSAQKILLRKHFKLYGTSIIETFFAWWGNHNKLDGRVAYEGLQHLQQALQRQRGVILLTGHFTTLELGGWLLTQKQPFHMIYRKHKNTLFEAVMRDRRERRGGKAIDRKNIRSMLRSLKENHAVWYAPDQDYGRKYSVFVPFMGINAATVTATGRLAHISGAQVVPYFVERLPDYRYRVVVHPALQDFPARKNQDASNEDAIRINQIIEQQIRKSPENYLWTHRRFKTRPEGERSPYS